MKKKISPGVFLTAFALSLFMSMSLKNVKAQVINNPASEPVGVIGGGTYTDNNVSVIVPGPNPTGEDQEPIVRTNPTGTGGSIGVTPLTATGGTIGATPKTASGELIGATPTTATGVPMGATTKVIPTPPIIIERLPPEKLQGTGFKPKIEANECIEVGSRGRLCGDEAMGYCRMYPDVNACKLLIKNRL